MTAKSGASGSSKARKRKKSRKKPKFEPEKFWGDPTQLPVRADYVTDGVDPTAIIRSLGRAPIPGKNSAPELYFEVLYQRAASLAQALAIAGNLNGQASEQASPESAELSETG